MTLPQTYTSPGEREFRREMMRVMSEVTNNPANVIPERQEELAMFMVRELKAHLEAKTDDSEKWIPENPPNFAGV